MLDAGWVDRHHRDFDVFHVHFGFDAVTPGDLEELVRALRRRGKPLIMTVHDLRNPHHDDTEVHDAQLDVLVPAAQLVVTLTSGAARQIERRWGRPAVVVPHPHVVDVTTMRLLQAARATGGPFRVGLHAKSLRACMDPTILLPVLAEAVDEIPDGELRLDVHHDVADPDGARHAPELMAAVRALGERIDVHVHDFFSDDELFAYVASLDVSVLPYRFGTHSGWLEMCRDLGTQVVAPTCGFYAEQGPVESFLLDDVTFDPSSLRSAVHRAHRDPRPAADVAERVRQRGAIAAAHRDVYEMALAR